MLYKYEKYDAFPPQIGDLDAYNTGRMTKITHSTMQKLRGMRPGYKTYYKTTSPSKQKGSFL